MILKNALLKGFSLFLLFSYELCLAQLESPLVKKTEKIFNELNINNMHLLKEYYAPNIEFFDPLVTIKGLDALTAYYQGLYQNVQSIRFQFHDAIVNEKSIMATWTMYYKVPSLNDGEEIAVQGNSHIKFNADDLVIYHRDYFDVGAMVYEHVPVVGWLVRKVKKRLQE